MNYGVAEQEIVTRLNNKFTQDGLQNVYEAVIIPENDDEAKKLFNNLSKGRVAVQFYDSLYKAPNGLGCVRQDEDIVFRLSFFTRKLRGEGGFYNLIEKVKLYLMGYSLSNTDQLTVLKYGLNDYENNGWQLYLDFQCKTVNVQDLTIDDSIGGPLVAATISDSTFSSEYYSEFE